MHYIHYIYCTKLHHITLHCIRFQALLTPQQPRAMHFTLCNCIALHLTTPHCIALHKWTFLCCAKLHCPANSGGRRYTVVSKRRKEFFSRLLLIFASLARLWVIVTSVIIIVIIIPGRFWPIFFLQKIKMLLIQNKPFLPSLYGVLNIAQWVGGSATY